MPDPNGAPPPAPAEGLRLSFRAQIALFGLGLVMAVAIPVLALELRRPWDALDVLIAKAKIVLAEAKSGFSPDDLDRMSRFAFETSILADPELEDPLVWTYSLMATGVELPPETEMRATLREQRVELGDFNYAKVQAAAAFWQEHFDREPGLLELFKKYKKRIVVAKENARAAGFELEDLYVMADDGNVLCFLVDGAEWYDATYPGQVYDVVENDMPYFRGYLDQGPGYDQNPRHYRLGLFPKFDTDKWGSWYSVWLADRRGGVYNNFAIDFDAKMVKDLMWTIGAIVIAAAIAAAALIALVAHRLAARISAPVEALVAGAEAVINADYDHQVPELGSAEFKRPIRVFNQMVLGLKERFNMKQTLEKLLSKELADQVASHGLVLGGQSVDITNLFTDFAGFSSITQHMDPHDTVLMLNEYFSALIPIIKRWGGLPDKYIGDAIVAIFGAPVKIENHAEAAVAAAIEMQLTLRAMNEQRRRQGKITLEMRIGLNSGECIAGAMGSDLKLEYTTIGETTNLANRMEANAQIGHILLSDPTYQKIQSVFFDGVNLQLPPQLVQVKGYQQPVPAYNLFVANLKISKNENHAGPLDFYIHETVDHHLQTQDQLDPQEKARFSKFIKVSTHL